MATYKQQRYLLMSTDPVHVGTGGYRLGRVDLSIVREPGTRVPKIPGTSLSGAARAYAASQYESIRCAGQGQAREDREGHCAQSTCPICYTFGYLRKTGEGAEEKTIAYSGVVNLFDAHVLLFPVHSMAGPVWVSTPERLREAGFTVTDIPEGQEWKDEQGRFIWERSDALNLGWLMLDAGPKVSVTAPEKWKDTERWQAVKDRIVLVKENLFGQVVNSNLEVRTSVSIDPERGAAEDGALFTYEALPRATFLLCEVVLDDYREAFPNTERLKGWLRLDDCDLPHKERKRLARAGWEDDQAQKALEKMQKLNLSWGDPLAVVQAGFSMMEWLGVGGMGTRGFGRVAVVGDPVEEEWK